VVVRVYLKRRAR